MTWHTHIAAPEPNQTALIAVHCPIDDKPFLLDEIYRFDVTHGCWMSESSGLKLKHAAYWWMPESALLAGLPPAP